MKQVACTAHLGWDWRCSWWRLQRNKGVGHFAKNATFWSITNPINIIKILTLLLPGLCPRDGGVVLGTHLPPEGETGGDYLGKASERKYYPIPKQWSAYSLPFTFLPHRGIPCIREKAISHFFTQFGTQIRAQRCRRCMRSARIENTSCNAPDGLALGLGLEDTTTGHEE